MGKEYVPQLEVVSTLPAPADVLLFEDFEAFFGWSVYLAEAEYIRKDPSVAFTGNYSLVMRTRIAGALATDETSISKPFGTVTGRYVEFSARFYSPSGYGAPLLRFAIRLTDYDYLFYPEISWNWNTSEWKYRDSTGAYSLVPGNPLVIPYDTWTLVKLVVDFPKYQYVSLSIGNQIIDLSGIDLYKVANTAHLDQGLFQVFATNTAAVSQIVYLDNIFIRIIPSA